MARFRGAIMKCSVCGSEFKVPPSRAGTAKTCSPACRAAHVGAALKRSITIRCEQCRRPFEIPESHGSRRRFCSRQCREASPAFQAEKSRQGTGSGNSQWKGGRAAHSSGYVYRAAKDHPFASNGYVFEHRLVMEEWLRANDPDSPFLIRLGDQLYLSPDFVVHHRDEDKANNCIENLECMTPADHRRHHNAN